MAFDPHSFAFVAEDGNVYLASLGAARAQRLTWDWGRLEAEGDADRLEFREDDSPLPLVFRWPTWTPDGGRLHCIAARKGEEDGEETHYVIDPESAVATLLLRQEGRHTIYALWSSDGRRLAAMLLHDDAITLTALRAGEAGPGVRVARGLPLFAAWAPGDTRLLVALGIRPGAPGSGGLYLCDGVSGENLRRLHPRPGLFRAPAPHPDGDRFAFAAAVGEEEGRVVVGSLRDGTLSELATARGQTALLWRPRLGAQPEELGVASAPRGPQGPFEALERVSESGDRALLYRGPFAGFFWTPDGEQALVCALTEDTGVLEWRLVGAEDDENRPLCRFRPSRPQGVMLSFFDQYAQSHPAVSPDSRHLLFAGAALGGTPEGMRAPLVYAVDLLGDGEPAAVAEGSFAVWRRAAL